MKYSLLALTITLILSGCARTPQQRANAAAFYHGSQQANAATQQNIQQQMYWSQQRRMQMYDQPPSYRVAPSPFGGYDVTPGYGGTALY